MRKICKFKVSCRPMINKPLKIKIPIIIPIKGSGFMNQLSTLALSV